MSKLFIGTEACFFFSFQTRFLSLTQGFDLRSQLLCFFRASAGSFLGLLANPGQGRKVMFLFLTMLPRFSFNTLSLSFGPQTRFDQTLAFGFSLPANLLLSVQPRLFLGTKSPFFLDLQTNLLFSPATRFGFCVPTILGILNALSLFFLSLA